MRPPNDTSIILRSGKYFDFARPTISMICIEDIAYHLAAIRRFSGMGITVAEHCVLGANFFEACRHFQPALAFLLHDAAEAYVGDVPAPRKQLLPDHMEQERAAQSLIWEKYLPMFTGRRCPSDTDLFPAIEAAVKRIDSDLLIAEALEFTCWRPENLPAYTWEFYRWDTWPAEIAYLETFNRLTSKTSGEDI